MSEPFVGEIRMFAGNFAPRSWAFCDGQLLAISQNDALFSLLGTIYGGDGRTTFGLPDMRGRVPVHAGQGPGLPQRRLGAEGGQETVTLNVNSIPAHTHQLKAVDAVGTARHPENALPGRSTNIDLYSGDGPDANLSASAILARGGSQPHANVQPFQCIHFIISLLGLYPSR